jgi:pimeloyl-ACP methyl ester carboxylesterase
MQQTQLQINGTTLAVYESGGSGPAVLLIHGNSADAQTFSRQLSGDFGNSHRVVAFDLPGHGHSSAAANPEAAYSLGGYASVVVELVERLQRARPVIVGWSLGGHIALEAVGSLPDAAGFFIYGAPPIGIPLAMDQAFLPNPDSAIAFSPTVNEEQARALAAAFLKPGATISPSFLEAVHKTDGQARAQLGASIAGENYKDEVQIVANMRAPLAVVTGDADQLVNVDSIRSLTMPSLWRGQVQIIEDAGHTPHWEQPKQFNALLAKFVADVR